MTEERQKERVNQFIKESNCIISQLTEWQIEKKEGKAISKIEIANKWREFSNLYQKAKKESIYNKEILELQYKTGVRAFKFFEEIVPIFKNLPNY